MKLRAQREGADDGVLKRGGNLISENPFQDSDSAGRRPSLWDGLRVRYRIISRYNFHEKLYRDTISVSATQLSPSFLRSHSSFSTMLDRLRRLWCLSKIFHVRGRERLTIPQHPL